MIPVTGTPAGGGYSTVEDLHRLSRAFTTHQLLDPRYSAWVVTNQLPPDPPTEAGYGIGVAGGAPGVNAELEISDEYTIVALANLDAPAAGEVARQLLDLLEALVEE